MGYVHDDDLESITKDGAIRPKPSEKHLVDVEMPTDFDVIDLS